MISAINAGRIFKIQKEETMKTKVVMEIEVNDGEMDGDGQIEEYIKMTLENGPAKVTVDSINAREIY